jgi:hypothetical protein
MRIIGFYQRFGGFLALRAWRGNDALSGRGQNEGTAQA